MKAFLSKLTRRKPLELVTPDTSLRRCLSVFDLTLLGIGSMIGSGIYVMTGIAAKEQAGPALMISFILSAMTVLVVAACFAEFAARVHRTGSTYLYMYICLGEYPAFMFGFAIMLMCTMGGATNARAWSGYLDSLFDGAIRNFTITSVLGGEEWQVGAPVAPYPDIVAMVIVLVLTLVIALGAKCSSWFNSLFAFVNVGILVFVIVVGFVYADLDNWRLADHGGFMPFGFQGVLAASGICFWAFSGFEIITCAVEESRNPKRDIPISMLTCMLVVAFLYIATSAAITLVTPYYTIETSAPLPSAFAARGLQWARYIVAVGPLCGLTTTLMSSLYSFVRVAYAIAEDGLIFPIFSRVQDCSRIPVVSVLLAGCCMATLALLLDLQELIGFGVVLTLIGYILVASGVVIMRYRPDQSPEDDTEQSQGSLHSDSEASGSVRQPLEYIPEEDDEVFRDEEPPVRSRSKRHLHDKNRLDQKPVTYPSSPQGNGGASLLHPDQPESEPTLDGDADFQTNHEREVAKLLTPRDMSPDPQGILGTDPRSYRSKIGPLAFTRIRPQPGKLKPSCRWLQPWLNFTPGRWPTTALFVMILAMTFVSVLNVYCPDVLSDGIWWTVLTVCLLVLFIFVLLGSMYAHQQNVGNLTMKMPCVPVLPSVAIFLCMFMLVSSATTSNWIGTGILFLIGSTFYFSYGIRHSKLNAFVPTSNDLQLIDGARVTLLTSDFDAELSSDAEF